MTLDQIVEETRQMPANVMAELVDRIMLARHGIAESALNPTTCATVRRRVEQIRSGKEKGSPGEVVSARIRQILGR